MFIQFNTVMFKNFMSYGNKETQFNFENNSMTLLTGKNGHGKTTISNALYYALFGKSQKKTKLGRLVNDINNSNMLVVVNFSIGGDNYIIRRGQKPNIFDIEINGQPLDKHSSVSEQQAYLENNILKINENIFKQLIYLGSNMNSSKNFMELSQKEKEEIFQIITDTSLFGSIKDNIKTRFSLSKAKKLDLEYRIGILNNSINSEKSQLAAIEQQNIEFEKNTSKKISLLEDQRNTQLNYIDQANSTLDILKLKVDEYKQVKTALSNNKTSQNTINDEISKLATLLNSINAVKNTYKDCVGCEKLKTFNNIDISESNIKNIENNISELNTTSHKLQTEEIVLNNTFNELTEMLNKGREVKIRLDSAKEMVNSIEHQIEENKNVKNINVDYTNLNKNITDLENSNIELSEITELFNNLQYLQKFIDDDNIKSFILSQQVPLFNQYINQYLRMFNSFDFIFTLDSSLKETISKRGGDRDFEQLSNGQATRITFSIMFTFLKMVEERNGIRTNVLFLDEVLDSSLDSDGKIELLQILKEQFTKDRAIVIISHNEEVKRAEQFDSIYFIKMENDFSNLTKGESEK